MEKIPVVFQERLHDIGSWLTVNGDAIYFTRIWEYQNESDSIFYTKNDILNSVFGIFTDWPSDNILFLTFPIPSSSTEISLLGYGPVKFKSENEGVLIFLPDFSYGKYPCEFSWSIKMTYLQNQGNSTQS